jgi:hypothetical protein
LIALAHLDLLHLLPKVFGRTLAPPGAGSAELRTLERRLRAVGVARVPRSPSGSEV